MIRRASPTDAPGIIACITAAYAPVQDRGVSLPPVAEGVPEDIRAGLVWVSEDAGQIRGILVAGQNGEAFHVMNLAVQPDAGGRGVGRALLDHAEHVAKELGCRLMRLATHRDMPENVALYTHLGWQVDGQDGVKVLMAKPVSG